MSLSIQPLFRLCSVKLLTLFLLFVTSSSAVSEAGVMLAESELGSTAIVDASSFPVQDADVEDPKLIESFDQEDGMTGSSSGSVTFPDLVSCFGYRSEQPHLVRWLVSDGRMLIPSPIPISLLKVPIEVE